MRNLTKVLALVLALTMVVGVAAFAASYTDVEKNANYAEAVSVLSDLGLVKGYEDGTFGADKTLTRAEATAFVLRLMNLEEAAISNAGADTGFSDVPADHWAAGYIYTAKTNNIVAGNGDGTFAPDANLTFAQIVKMIVVALGYNPLAAELGEWPGNYITAGSQIKLTTGIAGKADEEVTRATTARLLYSALSIPKMEKKGVGVNATWEPGSTLILDDLGFYKVKGSIASVDLDNDRATIVVDKQGFANEKGKYVETTKDMTIEATLGLDEIYRVTAKLGNFGKSLKDLVNVPAYIYIADDGEGFVVASIVEQSSKVDTVEFNSTDYADWEAPKLKYYTNEEQTKTATIKLAETLDVVANGGDLTADVDDDTFVTNITSEATIVELKDTDADGKFDYAILTTYDYMIVDEIKVKNDVYTFKALSDDLDYDKLKVDTEDEDLYLTIIKDGAEIELDEIEEGDVLNIVAPAGGIDSYDNVTEATIYVTNEKVEGAVKYVDEDVVVLKDGTELKGTGFAKGDEGIFVLGILGNIIYLDTENVESSLVYGYATVATLEANRTAVKTANLRVLGTDGTWSTIDFAEKVAINDAASTKMLTIINSGDFITSSDIDENNEAFIFGIVAYELDSDGAIKTLITEDFEDFNGDVDATYIADEEENRLGGFYVGEATAIFSIKAGAMDDSFVEEDEIKVTDISVLKDGKAYENLVAYDIDEDDSFIGILYGTFEADVDIESAMFVVTKAVETTLDEDEDTDVIKLTGYQEGEAVVYYYEIGESVVNSLVFADLSVGSAVAADALAAGDVLFVNADANGIITKAIKFANVTEKFTSAGALDSAADAFAAVLSTEVTENDEGNFVQGYVYGKEKTKVYVDAAYTDVTVEDFDATIADEVLVVNSKTAVTVYDLSFGKNPVVDGSASDIEEGTVIYGRTNANGTLVEVIVVKAK